MLYTSPSVLGANAIPEILITADGYNVDLSVLARAHGWNGVSDFKARVIVQAGVKIGSRSTATAALTTGALPATSQIELINNGIIVGKGGNGGQRGSGGHDYAGPGGSGLAGGPALKAGCFVKLDNTNGIIGGGGGGGGGGANQNGPSNGSGVPGQPGGGGAGRDAGYRATLLAGGAGIILAWGDDGVTGQGFNGAPAARYSGRGGNLGQAGARADGSKSGRGGAAGAAIIGIPRVTFIARGDIRGVTS